MNARHIAGASMFAAIPAAVCTGAFMACGMDGLIGTIIGMAISLMITAWTLAALWIMYP